MTELSKKLSLKDKRKVSANVSKVEKPLSRNVRFLDLSNNNNNNGINGTIIGLGSNRKVGDSTTLNLNNNSGNGSKS